METPGVDRPDTAGPRPAPTATVDAYELLREWQRARVAGDHDGAEAALARLAGLARREPLRKPPREPRRDSESRWHELIHRSDAGMNLPSEGLSRMTRDNGVSDSDIITTRGGRG